MVSWEVSEGDIKPLHVLADSLGPQVSRLDDSIFALSFDSIVQEQCRGSNEIPCSVDCVCITSGVLFFIEYKRESKKAMDEIQKGYECKCRESLLLFDRFISHDADSKRVLVIVTQDPRGIIADNELSRASAGFMPKGLVRYQKKDKNGQALFYDEIRIWSAGKFVSYANRNLIESTHDSLSERLVKSSVES